MANHIGEQYEDGRKVLTFNDEPKWFDISFVGRPADRIAWNLKVASSEDLDSVKLAEYEGVTAPDELACETESSRRKLGYMKDLSSMQDSFVGWTTKQTSVVTARDQYIYSFRKIASATLDAETVSRLRELPIKTAMFALAQNGVLMDVPTFFKYATGDDYETVVKPYMEAVQKAVPSVIRSRVKQAECASLCNDATYDAAPGGRVPGILAEALNKQAYDIRGRLLETPFNADIPLNIDIRDNVCSNGNMVEKLAEAYVSYQLSAIDAVVNSRRGTQLTDAEALASVTNLKNQGE